MDKVLIYGGGRLGRQVYSLLAMYRGDDLEITGFVDDVQPEGTPVIAGVRTLGGLERVAAEPGTAPGQVKLAMCIGYADMPGRGAAYARAKREGYEFVQFIHPSAMVEPDVELGEGCMVLAGTVLDQRVKAGPINHFDISTIVGEHTDIGENNYFAAGATIAGSVDIGRDNFIGLDVTIVNDIGIGNNTFINAKTLVHRNVPDNSQVIEAHQTRIMSR